MNHYHSNKGTCDTALQLTGFDLIQALCDNYGFADAAKQTPLFARIIPSMIDYYETKNYVFVHGRIPCVENWKKGRQYDPHWRDADPIWWEMARWYNGMDAVKTYRGKKRSCAGIGILPTGIQSSRAKVQSLMRTQIFHRITRPASSPLTPVRRSAGRSMLSYWRTSRCMRADTDTIIPLF